MQTLSLRYTLSEQQAQTGLKILFRLRVNQKKYWLFHLGLAALLALAIGWVVLNKGSGFSYLVLVCPLIYAYKIYYTPARARQTIAKQVGQMQVQYQVSFEEAQMVVTEGGNSHRFAYSGIKCVAAKGLWLFVANEKQFIMVPQQCAQNKAQAAAFLQEKLKDAYFTI